MSAQFDDVDVERLRRRRTVKWTLYGPDVLAAWVAEMDFDVAPVGARRARSTRSTARTSATSIADLGELTTACADFLAAEYGWTVPPARIFPVADVLTGISAALDVFVAAGSGVVVPTPAYPPFFEIVELTGREVVAAPMIRAAGRDALDLDAIDAALGAGARAVLLCNPHNPTGRVFTADELGALAAIVDRHGARVVADEVHAPLVYAGARATSRTRRCRTRPPRTRHGDVGVEGVQPRRPEVRAGRRDESCRRGAVAASCASSRSRARRRSGSRRPTRRTGPAATGCATSSRTSTATADCSPSSWPPSCPASPVRLPEATFLAWLDCSALGLDDPARFFLDHARVALSDGPPFGPGCEQHVRLNFATSRALLEQIVGAMGAAIRRRRVQWLGGDVDFEAGDARHRGERIDVDVAAREVAGIRVGVAVRDRDHSVAHGRVGDDRGRDAAVVGRERDDARVRSSGFMRTTRSGLRSRRTRPSCSTPSRVAARARTRRARDRRTPRAVRAAERARSTSDRREAGRRGPSRARRACRCRAARPRTRRRRRAASGASTPRR